MNFSHAFRFLKGTGYKGDDKAVQHALRHIAPIDLHSGKRGHEFNIINDFIAVVDGRRDLPGALNLSRELIQRPEFPVVNIVRGRSASALERSASRIQDTFSSKAFGYGLVLDNGRTDETPAEARMRRSRTMSRGTPVLSRPPAKGGSVIPWPGRDRFFYQIPLSQDPDSPLYETNKIPFWKKTSFLGRDFQEIFHAGRMVYPEFLSWYIKNDQITSPPGLLHFDPAYHPELRRRTDMLPKALQEAAIQEEFTVLPGNIAITVALSAGGTITVNRQNICNPESFTLDQQRRGHQAKNGDIMIARGLGWPDDPATGRARLPGFHCSPLINLFGQEGDHRGRTMAGVSCEVSYPHPRLMKHIESLYPG